MTDNPLLPQELMTYVAAQDTSDGIAELIYQPKKVFENQRDRCVKKMDKREDRDQNWVPISDQLDG